MKFLFRSIVLSTPFLPFRFPFATIFFLTKSATFAQTNRHLETSEGSLTASVVKFHCMPTILSKVLNTACRSSRVAFFKYQVKRRRCLCDRQAVWGAAAPGWALDLWEPCAIYQSALPRYTPLIVPSIWPINPRILAFSNYYRFVCSAMLSRGKRN